MSANRTHTRSTLKRLLKNYQRVVRDNRADIESRLKIAHLLKLLDQKKEAVEEYSIIAKVYARNKLPVQAISICKTILELDPDHQESQHFLAALYASTLPAQAAPLPDSDKGKGSPMSEPTQPSVRIATPVPDNNLTRPVFSQAPLILSSAKKIKVSLEKEIETPEEEKEQTQKIIPLAATRQPRREDTSWREYRNLFFFSNLDFQAFLKLTEKFIVRPTTKGERVINEGDESEAVFIISSGQARVLKKDAEGREQELVRLVEGSFFGEFGLLSASRRHATVELLEDGELLVISRRVLYEQDRSSKVLRDELFRFYMIRLLKTIVAAEPLFAGISVGKHVNLIRQFNSSDMPKGAVVMDQGKRGSGFYVIARGKVAIRKKDSSGATGEWTTLAQGDYFGELSPITGMPVAVEVHAREDVQLLRLPLENWMHVMKAHPNPEAALARHQHEDDFLNENLVTGKTLYGQKFGKYYLV